MVQVDFTLVEDRNEPTPSVTPPVFERVTKISFDSMPCAGECAQRKDVCNLRNAALVLTVRAMDVVAAISLTYPDTLNSLQRYVTSMMVIPGDGDVNKTIFLRLSCNRCETLYALDARILDVQDPESEQ